MTFERRFFELLTFLSTPPENGVNFTWDGSVIGDIDDYVLAYRCIEDIDVVYIWSQNQMVPVRLLKFKNYIPIIADDLRELFGIPRIGMHQAVYKGHHCILQKYSCNISLTDYVSRVGKWGISSEFFTEIRRLFCFRWMICLTCNYENCIEVGIENNLPFPISKKENKYTLESTSNSSRLPKSIVKEWFENNYEIVDETIRGIIKGKDPNKLKVDIHKIIVKYSRENLYWVNSIFGKIIHLDFEI